eukprot:scaffold1473_cov375-Prasinococcus_capsulatus_cf.AAC.15
MLVPTCSPKNKPGNSPLLSSSWPWSHGRRLCAGCGHPAYTGSHEGSDTAGWLFLRSAQLSAALHQYRRHLLAVSAPRPRGLRLARPVTCVVQRAGGRPPVSSEAKKEKRAGRRHHHGTAPPHAQRRRGAGKGAAGLRASEQAGKRTRR